MDIIFTERAYTNSPHLVIETVWPCYTVDFVMDLMKMGDNHQNMWTCRFRR